jgi:hypothetical protein
MRKGYDDAMATRILDDGLMSVNGQLCTYPQRQNVAEELRIHLAIFDFNCTLREEFAPVMGNYTKERKYCVCFPAGADPKSAQDVVSAWNIN